MVSIRLYKRRKLVLCRTAGIVQSCAILHQRNMSASEEVLHAQLHTKASGKLISPGENVHNFAQLLKGQLRLAAGHQFS